MPKVIEVEGYRVMVYTRDEHPPAHVHVHKDGSVIKLILGEDMLEYHSFKGDQPSSREVKRAMFIVADNLAACWTTWRMHHP